MSITNSLLLALGESIFTLPRARRMTEVPAGLSCGSQVSCYGCFVFYVVVLLLLLCCFLFLYWMFLFSSLVIGLLAVLEIGFWSKLYVFFASNRVGSETLLCNQFDFLPSRLRGSLPLFNFQ